MHVISRFAPDWKQKVIHESSPGWDIVSARLSRANRYIPTQNDTSVPFGTEVVNARMPFGGYRSEDLEAQTFLDEAFDLVITQDVFEHLFNPNKAIQEIERTLKPGGVIIMTVPIVRKNRPSRRRAALNDGQVDHLLPPEYHGNPLGEGGSLVTMDWGYDIASILQGASGLSFLMLQIDNIDLGIRADFNEVLCGFKKPFTAES